MDGGNLRFTVEVHAPTTTTNSVGSTVTTYASVGTYYVDIRPASPREKLINGAVVPEITHTVSMRYDAAITAKHRIVFGSRVFDIVGPPVNVGERNVELVLTCAERKDGAA